MDDHFASESPQGFPKNPDHVTGYKYAFIIERDDHSLCFGGLTIDTARPALASYGPDATSSCALGRLHSAPQKDCDCGYHLTYTRELLDEVYTTQPGFALLNVELYGRVELHANGARGEHQKVLSVEYSGECALCALDDKRSQVTGFALTDNGHFNTLTPVCAEHLVRDNTLYKGTLSTQEAAKRLGMPITVKTLPVELLEKDEPGDKTVRNKVRHFFANPQPARPLGPTIQPSGSYAPLFGKKSNMRPTVPLALFAYLILATSLLRILATAANIAPPTLQPATTPSWAHLAATNPHSPKLAHLGVNVVVPPTSSNKAFAAFNSVNNGCYVIKPTSDTSTNITTPTTTSAITPTTIKSAPESAPQQAPPAGYKTLAMPALSPTMCKTTATPYINWLH